MSHPGLVLLQYRPSMGTVLLQYRPSMGAICGCMAGSTMPRSRLAETRAKIQ